MSTMIICGDIAIHTPLRNVHARWRKVASAVGAECFRPIIKPKFTISRNDRGFVIGSCFAQGVQDVLVGKGFNIASFSREWPPSLFMQSIDGEDAPKYWPKHFFHRYTPPSILQEIQHIFGQHPALNNGALLATHTDGTVGDYHYDPRFRVPSMDAALERRAIIRDKFSELRNCGFAIITLGLLEVWVDNETGLYFSTTPPYHSLKREPERYSFRVLGWEDAQTALAKTIVMIMREAPSIKIIITVSPVPLDLTFLPLDVTSATTRGKATLLAAAHEVAQSNNHIDYFPSYEMATLSARSAVWREDQRHIRQEFVAKIMDHFVAHYVAE